MLFNREGMRTEGCLLALLVLFSLFFAFQSPFYMNHYSIFFLLLVLTGFQACTSSEMPDPQEEEANIVVDSAAWVIQNAIAHHGGDVVDSSTVNFTFRDRVYQAQRQGSKFVYERSYTDKEGQAIADSMTNDSFQRRVNGEVVELTDKQYSSYSNSLNSVMYFAFLPYFLEDPAVKVEYQGIRDVNTEPHYQLKVTFAEEGGGKDFEDEYAYWFSTVDFNLNFLAYNFLVNGGGARFREAYNKREVGGVLFQDYINYKPSEDRRDVLMFDSLLEAQALDTLSRIELEDIQVQ